LASDLEAADAEIRPGHVPGDGQSAARLIDDIAGFRARNGLSRVVVVNVSSTEPPVDARPEIGTLADLEERIAAGDDVLPPSSLYAYAAFHAGCGYVEFTPSTGPALPALAELAALQKVPYAGRDGKTGETLVKSALAPMFADRALRVRSWSGLNLLGGGDGATLADPAARSSKRLSKDQVVAKVLGEPVEGETHIDYVPDLGEWKSAWDHVSFDGFPGVRMTILLSMPGCDSALAAPLVLVLALLTARDHEACRVCARPEPGPAHRPRARERTARRPARAGVLLQEPAGDGQELPGRPVRPAARLRRGAVMRALLELVRAPAALSVPGDTLAGAAAAGR